MKLNPDCLRDIMLLVEDRISVETAIENPNGLRKFSYVSIPCLVRLLPDSYSICAGNRHAPISCGCKIMVVCYNNRTDVLFANDERRIHRCWIYRQTVI
jgi:hypothetical protein